MTKGQEQGSEDFQLILETIREHGIDPDKDKATVQFVTAAFLDLLRDAAFVIREHEAIGVMLGRKVSISRVILMAHQAFIKAMMNDKEFQKLVESCEAAAKEVRESK